MSKNINTSEAEATKAEAVKGRIVIIDDKPEYYYYINLDGEEVKVQRLISDPDFYLSKGVDVYQWATTTKDEEATKEAQAKDAKAKAVMVDTVCYSVKLQDYHENKPPKASRQSVAEAKAEAVKKQIDAIEALQADGLTLAEVVAKLKAEALGVKE